jgi:hypothetical protein
VDEAKQKAVDSLVHAFWMDLESDVMGCHLIRGDQTTLSDVIEHLGVDGFVDAIGEELHKQGYMDPVTIGEGEYSRSYPRAQVLDYFQRQAKAVMKQLRKRA